MRCKVEIIRRSDIEAVRKRKPATSIDRARSIRRDAIVGLFSGLAQSADVDLHRLRQPGNVEVPLARQTISPASGRCLRLKAPAHQIEHLFRLCARVQIEIAAQVRPVIQRLDHRDTKSFSSKALHT